VVLVVELEEIIPLIVSEDRVEQDLSLVERVVIALLIEQEEGDQ
jgi:hypothetical protein